MFEFRNITKKCGHVTALKGVSFQITPGEIVGLIGANGAGKTTAIRHIIRYLSPDEGSVLLDGKDVSAIMLPPVRNDLKPPI